MSCVFMIKEGMEDPKEWYNKEIGCDADWEYDKILQKYHTGSIYLIEEDDYTAFVDLSESLFVSWETSTWIELAAGRELMYGYYSEDLLEAEFVHIKNGVCIRDYREYDREVEEDCGEVPKFENWVDVASYVDKYMPL